MNYRPPYRDSAGKSLDDYPRPSVAVDTAVLSVTDGAGLCVLLAVDRAGGTPQCRLPGTFLHPGETLADAVFRSLRDKTGVQGLAPKQLQVFDDPERDDRGWVLSVAHVDVVRAERIPADDRTLLVSIDEVPTLPFDHGAIIDFAVHSIRTDYRSKPDPGFLIPDTRRGEPDGAFTIRDLRRVHEAVTGETWNADTFRRSMLPSLAPTGQWRQGARGKPAELYVRAR